MLPSGYLDLLAEGGRSLRWVAAELRARAERRPDAPELWLRVRDAAGLADRLDAADDWQWQTGFASLLLAPQDLVALGDFAAACAEASPYRDDDPGAAERTAHGARLGALLDFLVRYEAGEFGFEDPAAYPSSGGGAPAS